jgi:hypothetical protein
MRHIVSGLLSVTGAAMMVLLMPSPAALAWGPEAHRTIALIADHVLESSAPAARAKLRDILATDKGEDHLTADDIASEATWADVLREKSPEARSATSPWHLVQMKADSPDLAAACDGRPPLPAGYPASHGPRANCVVDKIEQFERELQNPATSPNERLAAVQFLLNLVGDVSDPLDAIDHGDRGGECVAVQIGSHPPARLATLWEDTVVRDVVGPSPSSGAARILASTPAAEAQKWAAGTPAEWAQDSYQVAKSVLYSFAAEKPAGQYRFPERRGETGCASVPLYRVGSDYETKALAAAKTQLAKAGTRLARVLAENLK